MRFERSLPPIAGLTLLLSLAPSCGDLRTEVASRHRIDPGATDELPAHDPDLSWPVDELPTSVVLTPNGGARFLRNYVHVRPYNSAGIDALLAAYPFLSVSDPIPFTNSRGEQLSAPFSDRIYHAGGEIESVRVDRLLKIDWEAVDHERFAGVELPHADELAYTFDSPEALSLLRMLVWMNEHDGHKVASVGPVLLSLDPEQEVELRAADETHPDFCACVDVDADPQPNYDANPFIPTPEIDYLDCGRDFFNSGYDLLTLRASTVSGSWEWANDEQKIKMWTIPEQDYPITLPSVEGAVAYISLSGGKQFEHFVPTHAHNGGLPGPIRPAESGVCEWETDTVCSLGYTNAGVWEWKQDGTDDSVGVLFYETDEELCLFGNFLCAGLADDFIDHLSPISRAQTLTASSWGEAGVNVTLQTIEQCAVTEGETCNGLDDDCDGLVDESLEGIGEDCEPAWYDENDPNLPVLCAAGSLTCIDGQGTCAGASFATAESCNGLDDDCDGLLDEDVPGLGLDCGSAIGECEVGSLACDGEAMVCVGGSGPAPADVCGDGLDNDCDGTVDEGCPCLPGETLPCGIDEGECTIGIQSCDNGQWGNCSGVAPSTEICDGLDNDCNTATDEGLLNACNECGPVPVEICDFMDNDCDGLVDEVGGEPFALQNSCGECGPQPVEICNGVDDTCEGEIDEGLSDCGLDFVYSNFELNGAAVLDTIEVAKPNFGSLLPIVLVDEYYTNTDDDFGYEVSWTETPTSFVFQFLTEHGNGGSRIKGRIGVLGLGQDVAAPTSVIQSFPNTCPVALGVLDLGLADERLLTGTRGYRPATDDDYSFSIFTEPLGNATSLRGCGWIGNGSSVTHAWAHMFQSPNSVQIEAFAASVWNGSTIVKQFSFPNATKVFPLIAVNRYDTANDDDANWRINCGGPPSEFSCAVEVGGGNGGSHVRVSGWILGVP